MAFSNETFFPNSSQRIHGNFQHFFSSMNAWLPALAELRSGREWELLMSSSLSGSCVDIDARFLGLDNEVSDLNERKIALKEALSWRRLLQSILCALVPVTYYFDSVLKIAEVESGIISPSLIQILMARSFHTKHLL